MPMAKMHEFWILPKGLNLRADDILRNRVANWGELSFNGESMAAAREVAYYLWDYCEDKAYAAARVNDRMVMESFQCFLDIRTLREGYMPFRGLPMTSFAVIPCAELPAMADILAVMPPYAAWRRVRELCLKAHECDCNLLYRGITP